MEARLFDPENPPDWLDSEWWKDTDNCNHLDNRVHQARLEAAAQAAIRAATRNGKREGDHWITDLGAGDGGLLSLLKSSMPLQPGWKAWGYELITDSVRYANEVRQVDVRPANVLRDKLQLGSTVVMTEMLEHLQDPYSFLWMLRNDDRVKSIVMSSPHSETAEHHEWNHAWAWDREGYAGLAEGSCWRIVEHFDAEWSQIIIADKGLDAI